MQIEIKNFGPIDNLIFDLDKDLHLIYGKNTLGKSYAICCLYCVIKNIKGKDADAGHVHYSFSKNPEVKNSFEKFVENQMGILGNGTSLDCIKGFLEFINNELKRVILKGLENSLLNTFSSLKNLKNRYSNKNFEIIISISASEKLTIFSNNEGILDLKYIRDFKKVEIAKKFTKSKRIYLYVDGLMEFSSFTKEDFSNQFIMYTLLKVNEILAKLDANIREITENRLI